MIQLNKQKKEQIKKEIKPLSTSIVEILSPETVKELKKISKEIAKK